MAYGDLIAAKFSGNKVYCLKCVRESLLSGGMSLNLTGRTHYYCDEDVDTLPDWLVERELYMGKVTGQETDNERLWLEGQAPYQYYLETTCCANCQILLADLCQDYGYESIYEDKVCLEDDKPTYIKASTMVLIGNMRPNFYDVTKMVLILLEYRNKRVLLDIYTGWLGDLRVFPEDAIRDLFRIAEIACDYPSEERYLEETYMLGTKLEQVYREEYRYSQDIKNGLMELLYDEELGNDLFWNALRFQIEEC